jgi:hypothetical protein
VVPVSFLRFACDPFNMYPAVFLRNFISDVVNLVLSCFLKVHISLPYISVGTANVLYTFNLVVLCT